MNTSSRCLSILRGRRLAIACACTVMMAICMLSTPGSTRMQFAAVPDLQLLKATYRRSPTVPFPDDNPYSVAKAGLGHKLFFDPGLSADGTLSCATCHHPEAGWRDGQRRGIGRNGVRLARRTPTILDLAWAPALTWDGRMNSLEQQAVDPIANPKIGAMNLQSLATRLEKDADYRGAFLAAFGSSAITPDRIGKALATFERTVVSGSAPFDRWVDGDDGAIGEPAKRGFALFAGRGNCTACHSGWRMTDDGFHDIGLPDTGDLGRGARMPGEVTLQHAFKTPTLRDIGLDGPYMHDGSLQTLDAVVTHYAHDFVRRPSLDPDVRRFALSERDRADLVSFLQTLTTGRQAVP